MLFGGNIPIMSDWEWAHAPWNEPDIAYETCPDCNGDGGVWYDEYGKEYSVADYERLSEEDKALCVFEECARCNGVGEIEAEPYEPDYDDYND